MLAPKLQPPSGLHVILGDSAGGIFTRNYGRTNLLIDRDVLSCGPTTASADLSAWNTMRRQFWRQVVPDESLHPPTLNIADSADRLHGSECINLWAATGVSEQLSVAFSVHIIDTLGLDPARLRLLQFEQYRSRPQIIRGMGELNEENLAAHPEAAPLTGEALDDYRVAWTALTSPDPAQIERFSAARPDAVHWLKQAMKLMLRRFPDRRSGLAYWDQVMLAKSSEQPRKCGRIIGEAIGHHGMADGDFVGDWYLFWRLLRMGDERLPQPLLAFTGDRISMRDTDAMLTPFGREVLEGRASSHPANPIEEWAAGVHLSSSTGNLWFSHGARLVRG